MSQHRPEQDREVAVQPRELHGATALLNSVPTASQSTRLQSAQVARYGITADQLEAVKVRCAEWAAALEAPQQ